MVKARLQIYRPLILLSLATILSSCSINGKITAVTSMTTTVSVSTNLGSFSIRGITGGSDTTNDSNLNTTLFPTVSWDTSVGADFYEAIIYASNGTTVVCSLTQTALVGIDFSTCSLTAGQTYKASVWARSNSSSDRLAALNNPYTFFVNQNPVTVTDTITMMYNGTAFTGDPIANNPGIELDPDGDTLSIISVSTPTKGTASVVSGTQISYTPSGTSWGPDSFTYTVSDGRGGTSTATVNVKLMTQYTWMGLVNTTWGSNNWCASIATPGFSGTCAGGGPPTSATNTAHVAVFNSFCTSNCSPTISANATMYSLDIGNGYSGIITQGSTFTMNIGKGGWYQTSGDFLGGDSAITAGSTSALCDNSQMGMNISTTGTFRMTSGTFTMNVCDMTMTPGTFNHNNGTITFYNRFISAGQNSQSVQLGTGVGFYDVNVLGTQYMTTFNNGTLDVARDLTINRSGSSGTMGGVTANVGRNLTLTQCSGTGNTTFNVIGNNPTVSGTSCDAKNLNINASGTVTLSGSVFTDNYAFNSGTLSASAGSTLSLGGQLSSYTVVPGSGTYENFTVGGNQTNHNFGGATVNVNGNLTIADSSTNSGNIFNATFNVAKDLNISSYGKEGDTYTVNLVGTNQTITGTSSYAKIRHLNINSSGTVTFSGTFSLMGTYSFNSGTLSASGSNLYFGHYYVAGSTSISVGSGVYGNVYYNPGTILNFAGATWNIGGNFYNTYSSTASRLNNANVVIAGNISSTSSYGVVTSGTTFRMIGNGSTISQNPGNVAAPLSIGDGTSTVSVTALNNLSFDGASQDLTITNLGTLNMAGFNLTVSNNSGTDNVLTIDAGGTLNMGGGTHTEELLVNNGTLNP
jgi:hypothetical protein